MIISMTQRGNINNLAQHLVKVENERVEIGNCRYLTQGENVHDALKEIEVTAMNRNSRCKNYLAHVSLNPDDKYEMTAEDWQKAWDIYEQEFNLQEQAFITVEHTKITERHGERTHQHRVYSLIDEKDKKIDVSFFKERGNRVARIMEYDLKHEFTVCKNMQSVIKRLGEDGRQDVAGFVSAQGKNIKADPIAQYTQEEQQQAKHAGIDIAQQKERMTAIWLQAKTAPEFIHQAEKAGFYICTGDKKTARGKATYMAVDPEGNVWRLKLNHIGVKVADIRERLDGLADDLPTVTKAQKYAQERTLRPRVNNQAEGEKLEGSWFAQVYDYTANRIESFKNYMQDFYEKGRDLFLNPDELDSPIQNDKREKLPCSNEEPEWLNPFEDDKPDKDKDVDELVREKLRELERQREREQDDER